MPRHIIEVDHYIGQTVAFRLDPDEVGLVTLIHVFDGSVTYGVTWRNRSETTHYGFELMPTTADCKA